MFELVLLPIALAGLISALFLLLFEPWHRSIVERGKKLRERMKNLDES